MYKKILLKLSGEALMGKKQFGIDPDTVNRIAAEIKAVHQKNIQICIVIGGGNIFRGLSESSRNINRSTADQMGMLATVMNGLALQNALEDINVLTRVMSGISMASVCEPYIYRRAVRHLDKGRVLILVGGTGNPYFTTDTAAALRACEMECDVIVKATKVCGVYTTDPALHKNAVLYKQMDYQEIFSKQLKVMDASAISLAQNNNIPIIVLSILEKGNLENCIDGKGIFTLIKQDLKSTFNP